MQISRRWLNWWNTFEIKQNVYIGYQPIKMQNTYAERREARKLWGYFVWKITIFKPKNHIFSNFRRGARRVRPPPPGSDPAEHGISLQDFKIKSMCRAKSSCKLTDSLQILHEKSLSSLCMCMCLVTFLWSENLLLHIEHVNGFRDTCVCSCTCRALICVNPFPHKEHLYGLQTFPTLFECGASQRFRSQDVLKT
jgi:hypothetical protein